MKRILTFLIIAGGMTMYAAALDFGVTISNTTELNGTNKTFNIAQTNALNAFIEFPTGDFASMYISGEARFSGLFPIKPKEKAQLIPLAQAFRLTRTDWSGNTAFNTIGLQWAVGRTVFNDYSYKILSGLFDGGKVALTTKNADLTFALGYTGLTYKSDAKIRIDKDDIDRIDDTSKVLAPQRIFLLLSSSFHDIIPSHTFGIDAIAQFDLLKQTGQTHTQYLIPYIYGRIGRNVSWKYWAALQFGEDSQFFYSLASGLSLQYINPEWRYFTVLGALNWAAGDYDGTGKMRAFIPITTIKQTLVANGALSRFSNMLTAGLTVSAQPIEGLMTKLSYILLTSPNTAKKPAYVGSELSTTVAYQFYNDFDISFTGGVFIPNKNVIQSYTVRWLAELAFTIKL
jgi:hypothetical protein